MSELGYTLQQITITKMVADDGKILVRAKTGSCATKEVTLGYNYYDDDVPLATREMASTNDWVAIDIPADFDEETFNPDSLIDQDARLSRIVEIMEEESQKLGERGVKDETLLKAAKLAPMWGSDGLKSGDTIQAGKVFRFTPEGETAPRLYRARTTHMIQEHYYPSVNTAAQYEEIVDTKLDPTLGTLENPIEYDGNMALENGKYYTQNGVVYLCNRDTGNPVYHALADLVGLYVVVA